MATERSEVDSGQENEPGHGRAEIDTSPPFESVREATNRFGGMGFWKPIPLKPSLNASEAPDLERDLITKERETLDVLRELEATKNIVEQLKISLQKEASRLTFVLKENSLDNATSADEDGNHETITTSCTDGVAASAPGLILLELKQAKLNLTQTTNDLADIRALVDQYNKKLEKGRVSLEKTRQRLSSNTSKISCLEEELSKTGQKLQLADGNEFRDRSDESFSITTELQKLCSETQEFKKVGEAARSQVLRVMSEIEQTNSRIKTARIRLVAAKKMKEAARASEAVAFAEIKALSTTEKTNTDVASLEDGVTLTFDEYSSLVAKVQKAEEVYKIRVGDAMLQVDETDVSKTEILKKVEEATKVVKISKRALEEALSRVEAANQDKLAVEEALRRWRSEHGQKVRSSLNKSTKFKNSHSSLPRKEPHMADVDGLSLVNDELKPLLRPTLSIGQILSRKLLLTQDYENGMHAEKNMHGKHEVSLAQMLRKTNGDPSTKKTSGKENTELPAKRKKFGFAHISLLVTKQNKKKKKEGTSAMCHGT